jgi:hypothetical protein
MKGFLAREKLAGRLPCVQLDRKERQDLRKLRAVSQALIRYFSRS